MELREGQAMKRSATDATIGKRAPRPSTAGLCRPSRSLALGVLLVCCATSVACTEDPKEVFPASDEPRRKVSTKPTSRGDAKRATGNVADVAPNGQSRPPTVNQGTVGDDPASIDIPSSDAGLPRTNVRSDPDASAPGGPSSGPRADNRADAGRPTSAPTTPPATDNLEEALFTACGPAPVSNTSFTRSALRGAAADCAVHHYCRFHVVAERLRTAVAAYRQSPDEQSLERAREAFGIAMLNWSQVELFQFGPLASRAESAGKDVYEGQGIRDLIYSWPSVSRCRIEDQLVSQDYASRGMDGVLISGRGLFALETILYSPMADSDCAPQSATALAWDELGAGERQGRARDYAVAVAQDIIAQTERLLELWTSEDFRSTLVTAGGNYPDEQEALKVIAWALVYLEREVKDWKVGIPAGYTSTHPVTLPETPFARLGIETIRANLQGFRALFEGCGVNGEGLGFDDWLTQAGHAELAEDIVRAWGVADRTVTEVSSLETASPSELDALYQALRAVTSLLKADFFGDGSPLSLDLPGGVEGDTD